MFLKSVLQLPCRRKFDYVAFFLPSVRPLAKVVSGSHKVSSVVCKHKTRSLGQASGEGSGVLGLL